MEDNEKRKKIEFYIGKLQNLLTRIISESSEFKELKKLVNSEDSEIQFCIFSVMADKNSAGFLKDMDADTLQQILMEAQHSGEGSSLGEVDWTEEDRRFLKDLRIIL